MNLLYEFSGVAAGNVVTLFFFMFITLLIAFFRKKMSFKWWLLLFMFSLLFFLGKIYEVYEKYAINNSYLSKELKVLRVEGTVSDIYNKGNYEYIVIGNDTIRNQVLGGNYCFYESFKSFGDLVGKEFKVHYSIYGSNKDLCILKIEGATDLGTE